MSDEGNFGKLSTISSDICFVSHEDNIIKIIQEINDIVDAVFWSLIWESIDCDQMENGTTSYKEIFRKGR